MLTFNLKKEWFEKIKSGEKTHEYRIYNDYWGNRLLYKKLPCRCVFACGYPKKEDTTKKLPKFFSPKISYMKLIFCSPYLY